MSNLPTYNLQASLVTARNAEYTGTPFTDTVGAGTYASPALGCNRAGSNAAGLGLATGVVDPKLDDWSLLDQAAAARDPQDSQHIGGTANPINVIQGTDINDTLTYITVVAGATNGQGVEAGNTGVVNRTGGAVVTGDIIWGTNTVA